MDYLHAFGYARSQSVRPCYLRSDHDFCMHFRQLIFRLISDKFRQSMGNSRWPCHGLSRSVTAFSDNAQDLSIVFCLLSRFVTVCHGLSGNMLGNIEANMNLFPITCNLRLLHFDNACAICDHQKWLHYLHAFPIWPYLCAWILRVYSNYRHARPLLSAGRQCRCLSK